MYFIWRCWFINCSVKRALWMEKGERGERVCKVTLCIAEGGTGTESSLYLRGVEFDYRAYTAAGPAR
jgi:hypothetical protein